MMVPKFRAYIKDTDDLDYNDVPHKGHFVYGNLIEGGNQSNTDAIVGDLIEATDEYINPEWWCSIEKGLAEQSTGLKDANGNMIYENDIIKYFGANKRVEIKTTYGIVFYDSEHGCFNSRIQNEEHNKGGISPLDDLIVGNVHTNPELLEAQHEQ